MSENECQPLYTITIRFPTTACNYLVKIRADATVKQLIAAVCKQLGTATPSDHFYLEFNGHAINENDTVQQSGLIEAHNTKMVKAYPQLRWKLVYHMKHSNYLGSHMVVASSEQIIFEQFLEISFPTTAEQVVPDVLKSLVIQTNNRNSKPHDESSSTLISMPVFGRRAMDALPTIQLVLPIQPNDFDWNELLQCLATDLEINANDMVIVGAAHGSTKWKLMFSGFICGSKKTLHKIQKKVKILFTPASKVAQLIDQNKLSNEVTEVQLISAELENFNEASNSDSSDTQLTVEDIDIALHLNEQLAIVDQPSEDFLRTKSKAITTCILHTFQWSPYEYVIENLTFVYNAQLYRNYSMCSTDAEERILFHGTKVDRFDSIFDKNLINFQNIKERTDDGFYGRGIYLSSSPQYCVPYTRSRDGAVVYLLCCLVKLGRIFHVTDMYYRGRDIRQDADSHYARVRRDGSLIEADEEIIYEEFAVKDSNQIFPMIIVGLRPIKRFVVWRDARIADSSGSNPLLIERLKQQYDFNIYGCQSSAEGIEILRRKLTGPSMRCVVLTNGGDDGEKFVIDCRAIRSSIPIVVYCTDVNYHRIWAERQGGEPAIKVTGCPNDIFMFINAAFS